MSKLLKKLKAVAALISNIISILKAQYAVNKAIMVYEIITAIMKETLIIMQVIFPAMIIDAVIQNESVSSILGLVAVFAITTTIIGIFSRTISELISAHACKVDDIFSLKIHQKAMMVDFADSEDSVSLDKYRKARNSLYEFLNADYLVFTQLLGSIISLAVMSYIFASLDIIVLIVILVIIVFNYIVDQKAIKAEHSFDQKKVPAERKINYANNLMFNLAVGKEIRVYSAEKLIESKYDFSTQDYLNIENEKGKYSLKFGTIRSLFGLGQTIFIYGFAVYKYSLGTVTIGAFTMYIKAAEELTSAVSKIFRSVIELSKASIYYQDYREYLDLPENMRQTSDITVLPKDKPPTIEFKNVFFKYPNQESYALDNISLKINPGEKISVVGENGAGKTTFIKLLMRLYDVTEGEILINGKNVKSYDYNTYLNLFSPVFQDFKLFDYTIKENISFSDDLDEQRISSALKKAGLDAKVMDLPLGIDTPISKEFDPKGVELSGGEQQKLVIARALYKNAPISILDEPTAALDPIAEYNIYKTFNDMILNKTSIYISHRMSSSQFCDKIVVFQEGKIVEYGDHQELIDLGGVYEDMYTKQANYYVS